MRSTLAILLILLLSTWSLPAAGKPIWTVMSTVDDDGDGKPDRLVIKKGYDDDGDGLADREETTEKRDGNNDGDFDDDDETMKQSNPIEGNSQPTIQMDDPSNSRKVIVEGTDTNGDGRLDRPRVSYCDDTLPGLPSFEHSMSDCGQMKTYVYAHGQEFDTGQQPPIGLAPLAEELHRLGNASLYFQSTLAHPAAGCEGRAFIWHDGAFELGGGPFFESWNADLTNDGSPDASGSNNFKAANALRKTPGYYQHTFSLYPDSCLEPRREFGTLGVADFNWDQRIDGFNVWIDPVATTYTADIVNVEPVIVPHFADGADGLITYLLSIDNPSATETVVGQIEIRGDDGALATVGVVDEGEVSQIEFVIPPLGKVDFQTDGVGDLVVGSVRIFADGPIGAVGRFALAGVGVAGVGARNPAGGVIIPVRRVGELSTGVAYASSLHDKVTLTFTLKGADGKELGTKDIELVADGHDAKFIEELFDTIVTGDFEGTLCIKASFGTFVAEALELAFTGQVFTALPVTSVVP